MASRTSPETVAPVRRPSAGIRVRAMWVVLGLILLSLLVPPFVNVNRYRSRVAASIGWAIGREVSVAGIELQLLPRPGILLSNFIVADDPSYGAEPMLRADKVTAYLRLTSLWRGRLEIASMELENPSLNLVRRADGHWNLEQLVQRTEQASSAPTSKSRPESRVRFPYVEASSGRINFKLGQVKKAFAFADADFALWLESENEWGVRLDARPMRGDMAISDTGSLKMEGRFNRAGTLRTTPVSLKIDFSKGQLGQITKLIYGRDRGWRGGTTATAILTGTPAALGVTLDAQVDDFRRYDISLGETLRLRAHCTGVYSSPDDSLRDVLCESPVQPGLIRVRGSATNWGLDSLTANITAEQIPMARVIAFARHAKKDLPSDLTAVGDAQALLTVRKSGGAAPVWSGGGRTRQLALRSSVLKDDIELGEIEFAVATPPNLRSVRTRLPRHPAPQPAATGLKVVVKPFAISLGAASPATARGAFDEETYRFSVSGDAEVGRLVKVANALGVGTPVVGVQGAANVDLDVAGTWVGFVPPSPSGKLQLRNTTAELKGVAEPLHIASATATLAQQTFNLTALEGGFAKGPQIAGSATFPIHCTGPETCVLHFELHTDAVSLARLNQLLNPRLSRPWYHLLLPGQSNEDTLLKLRANGRFTIAQLQVGPLLASNVLGELTLDSGKAELNVLASDLLGGFHAGRWSADFTQSPPSFAGGGGIQRVSMEQLSALMHDNWATGTAGAKYDITLQGATVVALRDSAAGTISFDWHNGSLRHVSLAEAPMSFSLFTGSLAVKSAKLVLTDSKLQWGGAAYHVSGTAGLDRSLNVKLERAGNQSYAITGSLDQPRVEAVPSSSTQAALR